MKTYLVTGGAGFIGSNFIHYVLKNYQDAFIINLDKLTYAGNLKNLKEVEKKENYRFVKGDITDIPLVQSLFDQYPIDYVVNFAAESHVDRSIESPMEFVKTNIEGTFVLLDMAKKAWLIGEEWASGKKFLQISTDEVYGSLGETGLFTEETPLDPRSPYSASKASADLLVKAYYDTYKMPINITRCSNNYGPYQFPEKLIPLMINNCLNAKDLPVYGDGKNIRDWIYVEDHSSAIDLVLNKGIIGEVYNVGGGNERTNIEIVKTIINTIKELLPKEDSRYNAISQELIKYVADRKGHDRRYAIDSTKLQSQLGWSTSIPFEEGVVHTVKWYLDNSKWLEEITTGEYQVYYKKMYLDKERS
ncbi:dTDP-glucose 4,6-dehydratase [Alkaliphilus serpentinus]|uniref:dTDP-glucose 4,6-dehydratase n=1 Tax=Alkaliphilus serpentinus TaxID=1482731 RepID=A0A833M657_9FIRM|nr:dTDP-glucose 4,6-dehydratase [Alkaliphilus serpentinus]KAB3526632.1 dTDP-glucose 4,6-dehydratase [Alkaliphilus serpentinus]